MGEAASTFSCIAYKENPASIVSSTFSFEISPANIVCSRRQTESGQSLLRRTQQHECPINWARGGSRECNLPVVFTDIRRKVREGLKKALFQQRKLARKAFEHHLLAEFPWQLEDRMPRGLSMLFVIAVLYCSPPNIIPWQNHNPFPRQTPPIDSRLKWLTCWRPIVTEMKGNVYISHVTGTYRRVRITVIARASSVSS